MQTRSLLQMFPGKQSASDEQTTRHAPSEHRYGLHIVFSPDGDTEVKSSRHVLPPLGVHLPPLQRKPAAHSASVAQLVAHFVASAHAKPPEQVVGSPLQRPAPSHAFAEMTESVQLEPHVAPAGG